MLQTSSPYLLDILIKETVYYNFHNIRGRTLGICSSCYQDKTNLQPLLHCIPDQKTPNSKSVCRYFHNFKLRSFELILEQNESFKILGLPWSLTRDFSNCHCMLHRTLMRIINDAAP